MGNVRNTTTCYGHAYNHPFIDIYLTKCLLKVAWLREVPACRGSVSERLECSSNIASLRQ